MPARKNRSAKSAMAEQTREKVHVTNRQRYNGTNKGTNGQGLYNRVRHGINKVDFLETMEVLRDRASNMMRSGETEAHRIVSQLSLLTQMIKERWNENRDLPWRTVAAFTVAAIYFIGPFDILPDSIPFASFLDDAAVLAFCFKLIQHDLKRYAMAEGTDLKAYGL